MIRTWLKSCFGRPSRSGKARQPNRARLNLERLEAREVPTFLLAMTNTGLWRHNDNAFDGPTGWKQLLGTRYSILKSDVGSNGDVAATVNGYGVYLYRDSTGWQRLTPVVASTVAISTGYNLDYVAGSFSPQGVWRYDTYSKKWGQLTSAVASRIDVDFYGDVAATFAQYGTYRYSETRSSWLRLSQYEASSIAIAGPGYVAFAIQGLGTYRYDDGANSTRQITSWVASSLDINSSGNIVCAFQAHGVYLWEQFSAPQWHRVSAQSASQVGLDAANKVAAATGAGVFDFNTSASSYTSWINLTSATASQIAVGG